MIPRAKLLLVLMIMVPLVASSSACSHSTISSGTEGMALFMTPTPGGADPYNFSGAFHINKAFALPVDPNTPQIYGAQQLTLAFKVALFDLRNPDPQPWGTDVLGQNPVVTYVALAQGSYVLTNLEIDHPNLSQNPLPPPPYAKCIDGVASINQPGNTVFTTADAVTFTIKPGQTTLNFKLNVPGFIKGYQDAFTCQEGCGTGGSNCVTGFNEAAYRAAFLANLTID